MLNPHHVIIFAAVTVPLKTFYSGFKHMNLNGHFTLLIMLISICFFLPTPSSLTCWIQAFKISILTLCHFEIVLTADSVYSLEKSSKLPDYFELWPVTLFITSKSNGLMKIKTCLKSVSFNSARWQVADEWDELLHEKHYVEYCVILE